MQTFKILVGGCGDLLLSKGGPGQVSHVSSFAYYKQIFNSRYIVELNMKGENKAFRGNIREHHYFFGED